MSPQSTLDSTWSLYLAAGGIGLLFYSGIWIWVMMRTEHLLIFRNSVPLPDGPIEEGKIAAANVPRTKLEAADYSSIAALFAFCLIGLHLLTSFHLTTLMMTGNGPSFGYVLLMRLISLLGAFGAATYYLSRCAKVPLGVAVGWNVVGTVVSLMVSGCVVGLFVLFWMYT